MYICECVCWLLQICITHWPTSEDSSVAAGVATVATWWEDCFGEYINNTRIFWRPKNIGNHSWHYCTHHAHKTSSHSFPHCPFQKNKKNSNQKVVKPLCPQFSLEPLGPDESQSFQVFHPSEGLVCFGLYHSTLPLLTKKDSEFQLQNYIYIYIH